MVSDAAEDVVLLTLKRYVHLPLSVSSFYTASRRNAKLFGSAPSLVEWYLATAEASNQTRPVQSQFKNYKF